MNSGSEERAQQFRRGQSESAAMEGRSEQGAGPEFAIIDGDRRTLRQGPGHSVAGDYPSDNREAHFRPIR
jgi:hypothetical protein